MGGSASHPSEERKRELERREKEMDRREREPERRAMESDKREEEMGAPQVRYALPAAEGSSGTVDRPVRGTEHTEHVMLPQIETPQQMEEQLKAEYHPELEAREMLTEVQNPVRRNSKELQPPINMPENEPKPPATP